MAPLPRSLLGSVLLLSLFLGWLPARAQYSGSQSTGVGSGTRIDPNTDSPWVARTPYDRVFFSNLFTNHYLFSKGFHDGPPPYLFFPPVPPPLDSEIPVLAPLDIGPPAPADLAAFVGEDFYPLLAQRLAADDLPKPLQSRILAYRAAKVALQSEMRSVLQGLKDAEPDSRERQLSALRARQAARVAELEDSAEKFRSELRPKGIFGQLAEIPGSGVKGGWRVGGTDETPAGLADARRAANAIRGAAYFQEGLSAAQRRLLIEAAIDMESQAAPVHAAAGLRFVSFSPEPARIPFRQASPPETQARVDRYVAEKGSLKAELRDALHATNDAGADERTQVHAWRSWPPRRLPGIASLEGDAEELRRDLAALPNPRGPPAPPALPPELTGRIATYRRHKVELLRKLRAMLVAPTPTTEPGGGGEVSHSAEGPRTTAQAWLHDGASTTEIQPSNLRVSVAEFDRLQADLIAELGREEAGIRESLAEYVRSSNGPADRKSINDLLKDFEAERQQQESAGPVRKDYRRRRC